MNILGLDTCFPALTVAVGAGLATPVAKVVARTELMTTGHAERLMPLISEMLSQADLTIADIERVAVTIGPGSFTGTRIGIAAARALKLACEISIVSFTSLEAIAVSPAIEVALGENLAVAIDAHRGEAYVQVFDGATRDPLADPRIMSMTDLTSLTHQRPLLVVGTAAQTLAAAVNVAGGIARAHPGMIFPDMAAAADRAVLRQIASRPVEPLYLRPADAKPQAGKTLERAGA